MAWIYLFVAGLFETAWAIGLKYSAGFTKFGPSFFTAAAMIVSLYLLSLALRTLPVGTGYAVWTGIGSVGAASWESFSSMSPARSHESFASS